MSSSNKLYTKSYFMRRLGQAGITARTMPADFREGDVRRWCVLAYPGTHNIIIVCHKNSPGDFWFKVDSAAGTMRVTTLSMEVVVDTLRRLVGECPPPVLDDQQPTA